MKKISVPPSMMGYTVMDGRLINESPEPVMGLSKMAQTRKAMKRAEKVRMIAEGNELAEANIDLFKKF
jgi:hypothetical protein